MLEFDRVSGAPFANGDLNTAPRSAFYADPISLLRNLRSNAAKATFIVAGFVGLGLGFALTSTPLYTATSEIIIDARLKHTDDAEGANRSLAELGMDPVSIDSQVSVLTSQRLAIEVLTRLHLEHERSFAAPTTLPGALVASVRRGLGLNGALESREGIEPEVLEGFMKSLSVKRAQQTYVIGVSFTARTPKDAALLANTVVSTYVNDEIRARLGIRQSSDQWLKQKLREARDEVAAADLAVHRFDGSGDREGSGAALRDAQRSLNDRRAAYAALVVRADTALQRQSFPASSVSVLAEARPPTRKTQPNKPLILVLSAVAGLAAAMGAITYQEMSDKTFRIPSQIEADLQLSFIGMLPDVAKAGGGWRFPTRKRIDTHTAPPSTVPLFAYGKRRWPPRFDETLRAVKVAADVSTHHDTFPVVGVVSTASGEGRSTVAAGLADLVARSGRRVLLIDCDLRRPTLSRVRAPRCDAGLAEVLAKKTALKDAVLSVDAAHASFLPIRASEASDDTVMLDLKRLQSLLATAAETYDFAVLDLPPLVTMPEAAVLAPCIGAFVLVVQWGATGRAVVKEAMRLTPLLRERTAGVVLNKVDIAATTRMAQGTRDALYAMG